jgi:uncharacterized protein
LSENETAFDLEAILKIGDIDRELIRARRRLKDAPRLAAPQQARLKEAQDGLDELATAKKQAQRDLARLEGEAKSKQADIDKAKGNLNTAKSNDEYQVLLRTIATRESELGDLETLILEAYELQDTTEVERKRLEARVKSQEGELGEAKKRVKAHEKTIEEEIAGLETKRAEVAATIGSDHLGHYNRILESAGDTATAALQDEMCQGCFIRVRPDQFSKVKGGKELVTCTQCERILYMTE